MSNYNKEVLQMIFGELFEVIKEKDIIKNEFDIYFINDVTFFLSNKSVMTLGEQIVVRDLILLKINDIIFKDKSLIINIILDLIVLFLNYNFQDSNVIKTNLILLIDLLREQKIIFPDDFECEDLYD